MCAYCIHECDLTPYPLQGLTFDPTAIEFCARKVSAASGDARKALDVCSLAVELAEGVARKNTCVGEVKMAILGRAKYIKYAAGWGVVDGKCCLIRKWIYPYLLYNDIYCTARHM